MPTLPSYDQVAQLPAAASYTVPQDWVDYNGHMNIEYYFKVTAHAGIDLVNELGVNEDYMKERSLGVFTVEQHQKYVSELRLGGNLTVHPRLIGVGDKTVHVACYVLDQDKQKLSMIYEVMLLHIDFGSRRAAAFPDDMRTAANALLTEHATQDWDPGLSGAMAVR